MNKIICDIETCKAEMVMTKDIIETKFLSGGIQLRFFRCKKCGEKYLIDVTNKSIREKQQDHAGMIKALNVLLDIDISKMDNEEKAKAICTTARLQDNAEQLLNEIKEAKKSLKERYEGEL